MPSNQPPQHDPRGRRVKPIGDGLTTPTAPAASEPYCEKCGAPWPNGEQPCPGCGAERPDFKQPPRADDIRDEAADASGAG